MILKIRSKVILLVISIICIPFLFLGILSSRLSMEALERRFFSEQRQILLSINSNVIQRHKRDMENMLDVFSRDKELPYIFDDEQIKKRIIENWNTAIMLYPHRAWLYYGDRKNRLIASPEWYPDSEYDCRIRPWYLEAEKEQSIVWPEPFEEYESRDFVLTASLAIRNDSDELLGVLAVDTFIDKFLDLLVIHAGEFEVPIFISDKNGEILGSNEKDLSLSALEDSGQWEKMIAKGGSGYINKGNGEEYFVTLVEIPSINIYLASIIPKSTITTETLPLRYSIIWAFSIRIILSMIIAVLFSRTFVGNVEHLYAYVHEIGNSSAGQRICVKGEDELYHLNTEINNMVNLLRQRNETVNSLFYLISHNISSNIIVINQKIESLIRSAYRKEDYSVFKDLQLIGKLGESVHKLITGVVISRNILEQGVDILSINKISSTEIISTILYRQEDKAQSKRQTIELKMPDREIWINTDENLLLEILENIVGNAIKFSPIDGVIELSVKGSPGYTSFFVGDNGPGFSQEDEKHMYSKFVQLSARPTGGEVSNGLGLAISREIIEILGGDIILHRNRSYGALFEVKIPLVNQ